LYLSIVESAKKAKVLWLKLFFGRKTTEDKKMKESEGFRAIHRLLLLNGLKK